MRAFYESEMASMAVGRVSEAAESTSEAAGRALGGKGGAYHPQFHYFIIEQR